VGSEAVSEQMTELSEHAAGSVDEPGGSEAVSQQMTEHSEQAAGSVGEQVGSVGGPVGSEVVEDSDSRESFEIPMTAVTHFYIFVCIFEI